MTIITAPPETAACQLCGKVSPASRMTLDPDGAYCGWLPPGPTPEEVTAWQEAIAGCTARCRAQSVAAEAREHEAQSPEAVAEPPAVSGEAGAQPEVPQPATDAQETAEVAADDESGVRNS